MADNPDKVVTKFQLSSLFNKAWFLSMQPHTIICGFRKVGVYPFDSTVIKPYDNSSICSKTRPMMPATTQPNEISSDPQDEHSLEANNPGLLSASFSEEQLKLFERRYKGYNIYDDQEYVAWLQQQHPDDLPENLSSSTNTEEKVDKEKTEPSNCNNSTEDDSVTDKENAIPSIEQPISSLSASLLNTTVTELRVIFKKLC